MVRSSRLALALTAGIASSAACRISLEESGSGITGDAMDEPPACVEARGYQDLATIQQKIFRLNCGASSCHGASGDLKLLNADVHTQIVNARSRYDANHVIVTPGVPNKSYMLFMLRHITAAEMDPPAMAPPEDVGFMPQGGSPLCESKREAIERWILAGAPNL